MTPPRPPLREREVLDAVHRPGRGLATDVRAVLPDPPSGRTSGPSKRRGSSATRRGAGGTCTRRRSRWRPLGREALRHLLRTLFVDASGRALSVLLGETAGDVSAEQLDELDALVRRARDREGANDSGP